MNPWSALFVAMGLLTPMALGGCSSTTAARSDTQAPASRSAAGKMPGAKPSQQASRATSSSLEAHREGKTPASGPLKEIYFDFDKYELRDDARTTLKANAAWLKANPSARVEIEGHCDERGTSEYNLALGAKRAQAAKEYLQSLGIEAKRISTISYGEELPVCRQQTEECYRQNRRDRFVVRTVRPAS
ncbi:MAG TPA: peptidoglycan-associated lipoprotein Pal [candidate division Zixibacteria bacterium]|nr:peptidoglycan-associated lipoprotein Pal [candidate division Zixibacteria bacterium]